jgi:UDP-2,3-diacylglucosamine hydrolase
LAELSDSGIGIHFFTGNHDVWIFDYLPGEIGAVIHRGPLTIDLMGKTFFLAHGDEVGERSRMLRLIRAVFHNKFCQWLYAGIHPRWTFGFALNWSLNSRKNGLADSAAGEYRAEKAEYLIAFAREYLKTHSGIDFFLFGHRHLMLDLMLDRSTRFLIAGDWMTLFSYIEWDGETLALVQFNES